MIYYLTTTTLYLWPFGQLLSFFLPSLSFQLYLIDMAVGLIFLSAILSPDRKKIFSGPILKPLLFFLSLACLSLLVNISHAISIGLATSSFYLIRLLVYPSLFFVSKYLGPAKLKKPLYLSLGLFCLLSLIQYLVFPDMRYLKLVGYDDHYYRLIGPFFDPNFSGAVFAGLALYFFEKKKILITLILTLLLAVTFSRASYLVFIFGIFYLLLDSKKIKLLLLLLLLGIFVYLAPKPFGEGVNLSRTFSISSRLESWQNGLAIFSEKPFLGWGYNTLRSTDGSRFQIDNSYIFLLATTGLIGLVSFMALLMSLWKNTQDKATKILTISLLSHSFFNNTLFYIYIFALFWVFLGLGQKKIKECR